MRSVPVPSSPVRRAAAVSPQRPIAQTAAAAAVCAMGLCGETAAARLTGEEGTGTLRMYLMDAVSNLTGEQLDQGANDELYC